MPLFYPSEQIGELVARQAPIGDPENDPDNYIDAETATINALNARSAELGVTVGGPPGRIAGFNLAGTTGPEAAAGNVRAVCVIWTDSERDGDAPPLSVDQSLADSVFSTFPAVPS